MDVEADCGEEDERRSNGVMEKVVKEVEGVERRVRWYIAVSLLSGC